MNRHPIRKLLPAVIAGLLFTAGASADIYRWTDAEGNVQYSDRPPPDAQTEVLSTSDTRTSASAVREARNKLDRQLFDAEKERTQRELEREKKLQLEKFQADKEQKCREARERMQLLQGASNLRHVDERGVATRLTEDQRQARIKNAQSLITQMCN